MFPQQNCKPEQECYTSKQRRAQGLYCGLLPFGAMKGENGVPIPEPKTYPGLVLAFELSSQGKTDREVAQALNTAGYRTARNRGNRPFAKDSVRDMLKNRFYLGELQDGNGGCSHNFYPGSQEKKQPWTKVEVTSP